MTFADVLLPLPLQGTFTYSVPDEMVQSIRPGCRVIVPFGRKKFYTGIVVGFTANAPKGYTVKPIGRLLDNGEPILRHPQLKLWQWIADYYLCSPGEVYRAAVPTSLKVESETWVEINPDYEEDTLNRLTDRELHVMHLLDHAGKGVSVAELEKQSGMNGVTHTVSRLLDLGAVVVSERLVDKYRARRVVYIQPSGSPGDEEWVKNAFQAVKNAPKQERALLALLDLSGWMRGQEKETTRDEVLERSGVTTSIIKALETRGIVKVTTRDINRFQYSGLTVGTLPELTDAQGGALREINQAWINGTNVALLHGVTGSGKTEIYIHLISQTLELGRQALFLVPEIALTTQLTTRLQRVFGPKVVIYHSKFTDNERVDIWRKLLTSSEPLVVIGARSAVFLPFATLGLVIVDEEHDPSYKQSDPAPRYNGRDTALVLARMHGAKAVLGSATPSIETYYKATTGRYGLVTLTTRYGGATMPAMQLIDMKLAHKKKEVKGPLAFQTREIVAEALSSGRQAIIFLNRRGFAPLLMCEQCGWIPRCQTCDVSLTYHKRLDRLVCHYCGSQYQVPAACPACGEPGLQLRGFGTERIEDEVTAMYPDVPVSRLDLDSTRSKDAYLNAINDFSQGKTRVLVGTQMVTKGLDFDGVSAVAVVSADMIMNQPDFRATERAFNLIEQVAGRAGRSGELTSASVAIQTFNPSHPLFTHLLAHDYLSYYKELIDERRRFNYPPFTRVIYIYLKHRDERELDSLATVYTDSLRALLGTRVNGPDKPPVARVQSLYIRRVMLKIEIGASLTKVKQLLLDLRENLIASQGLSFKQLTIYYDVDPV